MLTRRYFPILFCANVAVLAAILPKLIDSARGGLMLLVVAVFMSLSLATLYLMGLSREARRGRRSTARAVRDEAWEAMPSTPPVRTDSNTVDHPPTTEALTALGQRLLSSASGPLAHWRPASVGVPAQQEAWLQSVVQSYQLFIITRLAEHAWGHESAGLLDAAFAHQLATLDDGRAATYRLVRQLLEQDAPALLDEDVLALETIEHCLAVDLLEDDERSAYRIDHDGHGVGEAPLEFDGLDVTLSRCLAHGRVVASRAFEIFVESAAPLTVDA